MQRKTIMLSAAAAMLAGVLGTQPALALTECKDLPDHAALFPRVAAVVHHGGAGTTTIAARAGVPQLIVPHLLDQYYWAERVRALGLGPPPLPRRRLDAASLAAALATMRGNDVLQERAQQIAGRLRDRADLAAAVDAVVAAPA